MPQNMCWDPFTNVAEVWCCSEHYFWLFDDDLYLEYPFNAVRTQVLDEDSVEIHKYGMVLTITAKVCNLVSPSERKHILPNRHNNVLDPRFLWCSR